MTDIVLDVLPAHSSFWKCPTCASRNEVTNHNCGLCKSPSPDGSTLCLFQPVASSQCSQSPSRLSLLDVGVDVLIRVLLYCGPRGIVHLGLTNKWCQNLSLRPVLWNFLLQDQEFFLNELPAKRKSIAQCFLQTKPLESLPLKGIEPEWQCSGLIGKKAFQAFMMELTRLCIEEEKKLKAQKKDWIKERDDQMSCSVMTDMNIFLWSCFLVEVTVVLLLLKLQEVGDMNWGVTIGPLATACVLDFAYVFPLGIYSFSMHCSHPGSLLRFDGLKLFFKALISVPWLLFGLLLMLNVHGLLVLPYSYILLCLEATLIGIAIYCTFRIKKTNHPESLRYMLMVYTAVVLAIAQSVLVGLKVDGFLSEPWVLISTPIWVSFVAPYCFMAMKRDTIIIALVSLPLVLYLYAPILMIPFQLDNPKQFGWTVIFYFFLPIFIFFFLGCCAYSCERQRCV